MIILTILAILIAAGVLVSRSAAWLVNRAMRLAITMGERWATPKEQAANTRPRKRRSNTK